MAAISDYLLTPALTARSGFYVRFLNNATGTSYISGTPTDVNGLFTMATPPPGSYTVYYGLAATVPGTATPSGDANYLVPLSSGDDAALKSLTLAASSPYNVLAKPGAINGEQWGPAPSGDTTGVTDSIALQAIIDSLGTGNLRTQGGKVRLWPGRYYLNKRLILWGRVILTGVARDVTMISAGSGFPTRVTTDGAITSGQTILTTATGTYTTALDQYKRITVRGAGVAGGDLETWIASVQSPTSITLNNAAGTTVTNARVEPLNEMIRLGDPVGGGTVLAFGTRLVDLTVDAQVKQGVTAVFAEIIQEQSGLEHVLIGEIGQYGYGFRVSQPMVGGTRGAATNWSAIDVEIIPQFTAGDPATDATAVGLYIDNITSQTSPDTIKRLSVVGIASTPMTTAVKLEGFQGTLADAHIEQATNGIVAGTRLNCGGMNVRDLNCGPAVTNAFTWANGPGQQGVPYTLIGLWASGSLTNLLVDQVQSITIPNQAGLGFWAVGTGAAGQQPILTSDTIVGNKLTSTGKQQALQLTDTGTTFGVGLKMLGDGATTPSKTLRVKGGFLQVANDGYTGVVWSLSDTGLVTLSDDQLFPLGKRLRSTGTAPTVGSGGAGVSALSVLAGSTNIAVQVQVTLTAIAPGVVVGVVTFNGAPLTTAPIAVVCSLGAPTAGVAAPPVIGADTFTASGFTIRSYGPTTVTTGTYVINCWVIFA